MVPGRSPTSDSCREPVITAERIETSRSCIGIDLHGREPVITAERIETA